MPITLPEQKRYRDHRIMRLLFAANVAFATLILVAWQSALVTILGPINWASDRQIPSAHDMVLLLEYPLCLYWVMPAMAMVFGWMMIQSGHLRGAFAILALPLIVMGVTLIMYYAVVVYGH